MNTGLVREMVVAELRQLPRDTLIAWGDDTSGEEPMLSSELFVWPPELARPLGLNWVWVITADEPADGIHPMSIVVPAGAGGWTPEYLSEVLREWTVAHTGRTDISYAYDATLTSDWVTDLAHRDRNREDPPVLFTPEMTDQEFEAAWDDLFG